VNNHRGSRFGVFETSNKQQKTSNPNQAGKKVEDLHE
jgi:hypothetical protein